ncbi:MAG: hypothetical protein ACR2NZ_07220 [Rubripirellula sp.]
MDGTTEPLLVVIGHPIAGNPSQFALERALRWLDMDWRVLSFDVPSDNVAAALEGFAATGIAGVLIDRSVSKPAANWYAEKVHGDPGPVDCLTLGSDRKFVGSNERFGWVLDQLSQFPGERLCFGNCSPGSEWSAKSLGAERIAGNVKANQIATAGGILIADDLMGPPELELDEWPENDGSTIVIDLTSGHPQRSRILELGYRVLAKSDRQIGVLKRALTRWTDREPGGDVIRDAVEEYLGV